ncbi:MAG: hemerythrin domain-containing protein [Pseudomonadota bacterium]
MRDATEAHRAKGRHLAAIHRGYLHDLGMIARVLEQIQQGLTAPDQLQEFILSSSISQNFHAFGTLCGEGCKILQLHHAMEEGHMFSELEAKGNAALTAIVTRLREEHKVIHALLDRLEDAAGILIADPSETNFAATGAAFKHLDRVIRSHFRYEETELEEPIGVYLDGI